MAYLLPGTNGVMAAKVSKLTGFPICYSQLYRYPDGEIYFRIATDVSGEDVIIFNSMYPKPDQTLFETIVMADTALDSGANSVSCVFPYFAYARTIERRLKREAIPLKVVSRILRNSGISRIYFVDFHLQERDFFGIETCNLTAMRELARYAVENLSDQLVVVAPDENATQWAEIFAEEVNSEIITMRKIRIDAENVIIETPNLELEGDAIIVDDIISTGATVCQAARILKKCGCDRVFAACTHAILASDALMRMLEAGIEDIISTDTIPGPISQVSVAEIVAEKLEEDF
jgi:ribose-phosphate pyrophosphokinase